MSEGTNTRRPMWREWAVILGVFAAVVFGGAFLGKIGTYAGNVAAASLVAAGTVALAVMTRRYSGFPRWATIASVAILALSAVGTAIFWQSAPLWDHGVKDSLWMHPWLFLNFAAVGGQAHGVCSTTTKAAGWMLIGAAILIAVLAPVISVLV
jgi:hypothetical protein